LDKLGGFVDHLQENLSDRPEILLAWAAELVHIEMRFVARVLLRRLIQVKAPGALTDDEFLHAISKVEVSQAHVAYHLTSRTYDCTNIAGPHLKEASD